MAKKSLLTRLKQLWYSNRKHRRQGFTLLELLIVTVIAATIVSGLVYMVVELMGADQREASRTETQRELQMAMDYVSNEMRQAVYVYTGECMAGQAQTATNPFCPGLASYIPPAIASSGSSVPIVAFWRQYPIPTVLRNRCGAGTAAATVPCLTAHSYALVIYSLSRENTSSIWRGRARITRYALTQFNESTGAVNAGYVNPAETSFNSWPWGADPNDPSQFVNLQAARPNGTPVALVDFVDDGTGAQASGIASLATNSGCPDNTATAGQADYSLSPSTAMLGSLGFSNARSSFYACVSLNPNRVAVNQDVILFARGNAFNRPGISADKAFLPTLETRVLVRGILDRNPPQ